MHDYNKFWENFGKHIKLGCIKESNNNRWISPLLRFFSSMHDEEMIIFDDYIEKMTKKQTNIYYTSSNCIKSVSTKFLEKTLQKDIEVWFFFSTKMAEI